MSDPAAGVGGLAPKWVRLAPNGTNPGLFQIRFQCIWRPRARSRLLWFSLVVVRLATNGTNPGLFQIRFQCIWRGGAKCTAI